jgi:hypothetical protein
MDAVALPPLVVTAEGLFSVCGLVAMAGWLLLVVAPGWSARFVSGVLVPAILAVVYLALIAVHFRGAEGGFGSLADVARLFQNPWLLLAGWVHYLAFDLFIGAWEVRDARARGIPHLAVIPCLFLTFLLGPIGLLLYLTLRAMMRRAIALDR